MPMPANPRRGACRGYRQPSVSSVSSVVQLGRGEEAPPCFARRVRKFVVWGVEGPPSCRCPKAWDRDGGRIHHREHGGHRGSPHDSCGSTPRASRSGLCFAGWKGPHPADARQSKTRSVSRMPSTLCGLRVLCGSTRAGGGGTPMLRPSSSGACCLGGGGGPLRPDAERAQASRAEITDCDLGGGGGAPILPMPANPSRRACRGCRQPSVASVSSVVQLGRGEGVVSSGSRPAPRAVSASIGRCRPGRGRRGCS